MPIEEQHASEAPGGFVHDGLLYRGEDEFAEGVGGFLEQGLLAGEPAMIAVPGPRLEPVYDRLGPLADRVRWIDMTVLGRNPGRIIPFVREWVDLYGGRRVRFVGEPVWPGRRAAEVVEGTRHEALINLAFADSEASILCPYDIAGLDATTLDDAERTHPAMVCCGARRASAGYEDPAVLYGDARWTPAAPPAGAPVLVLGPDLADVRAFVRDRARAAGMGGERTGDLLVAATEAATNALVHGGGAGTVRLWQADAHLVFEVHDAGGPPPDVLVGRRHPDPAAEGGRGVWLMHQLCDLVELHPSEAGTRLRLHMSLS